MSLSELHLIVYFVHLAVTIAALSCAYQVTQSVSPARWQLWLLLAVTLALGLAGFFASDPPTLFADFWSGYYAGGKAVLMGPTALRAVTDQGVSGLTSLPIVAYLFAPLTLLPIRLVAAMLAGASLLAVAASWMLIVRLNELDLRGRWLLAVLFAGSGPLQYSLREGNLTHFVLLALAGSLWLLKANRSGFAGTLLGAAAVIKPPLFIFGVFFLLRRDIRGCIAFAGVVAAAAMLSLLVFGVDDNLNWFNICISQYSHEWIGAFNDQSFPSFLFRFRADQSVMLDWSSYPATSSELWEVGIFNAVIYLIAAFAWIFGAQRKAEVDGDRRLVLQYMLMLSTSILVSPLVWSHYHCWFLLVAGFFLGGGFSFGKWSPPYLLAWAAIGLTSPLVVPLVGLGGFYWHFGVSHCFAGAAIWFGLIVLALANSPRASLANNQRQEQEIESRRFEIVEF